MNSMSTMCIKELVNVIVLVGSTMPTEKLQSFMENIPSSLLGEFMKEFLERSKREQQVTHDTIRHMACTTLQHLREQNNDTAADTLHDILFFMV